MQNTPKLWLPKQVLITSAAMKYELSNQIADNARRIGLKVVELKSEKLTGLSDLSYSQAKSTLAVVVSPPSQRKLMPIPPSADWQFHIARGCPAHCQYCYLAGSLTGPPITRVYANLDDILEGLMDYTFGGSVTSVSPTRVSEGTTFEASCYTDPLALEHLTGSISKCITFFGKWHADVQLRWTTKFDDVNALLKLNHANRTRIRFSVNAEEITNEFEPGTASLSRRLLALKALAKARYPVGLTIAPIMPVSNWQIQYEKLFELIETSLSDIDGLDLTVELITHRFTTASKDILTQWYPATGLEMDESKRVKKRTKFGNTKFVYPPTLMKAMKTFFYQQINTRFPSARILYWT